MTRFKTFALATAATLLANAAAALTVTDVVDATDNGAGYFFAPSATTTPPNSALLGRNSDWGWSHGSVTGTILSATLQVTAFGSNLAPHRIYAFDGTSAILLGALDITNGGWSTTTFTLSSSLFDDLGSGLDLFVDISAGVNNGPNRRVALASSTLTVQQPDPPPAVPLPASVVLLGAALAGLGALRRRG